MCECKCFEKAKEHNLDAGNHHSVIMGFTCPMCFSRRKRYSLHGSDGDYSGSVYECEQCHAYLRYHDDHDTFVKEQFHPNDQVVMVNYKGISRIYPNESDKSNLIELPIFEFRDKEDLMRKIRTYLVFQ